MPTANDLNSINLGRIVPAPNAGTDTSPTYFPPRLYILNAGATGQASNATDVAGAVALARSNQSNTGSPNPTSNVGSAGTAGLDGSAASKLLRIMQPRSAITGPAGAPVSPIPAQRAPKWLKPALYIAAGVGIGALVFRG